MRNLRWRAKKMRKISLEIGFLCTFPTLFRIYNSRHLIHIYSTHRLQVSISFLTVLVFFVHYSVSFLFIFYPLLSSRLSNILFSIVPITLQSSFSLIQAENFLLFWAHLSFVRNPFLKRNSEGKRSHFQFLSLFISSYSCSPFLSLSSQQLTFTHLLIRSMRCFTHKFKRGIEKVRVV